ncbi:hypothetical protein BC831DRAFT_477637, partial [Entophlyctis helioformis]
TTMMMATVLTIQVLHALCLLTRTIQSRGAMQAVRQRPTCPWTSWPVRQTNCIALGHNADAYQDDCWMQWDI